MWRECYLSNSLVHLTKCSPWRSGWLPLAYVPWLHGAELLKDFKPQAFHLLYSLSRERQQSWVKFLTWRSQLDHCELLQKAEGRRDKQRGGTHITQTRKPHPVTSFWSATKLTFPSVSFLCLLFSWFIVLVGKRGWYLQTPENPIKVSPAGCPCGPMWKPYSHDGKAIATQGSVLRPGLPVMLVSFDSCWYQLLTKAEGLPRSRDSLADKRGKKPSPNRNQCEHLEDNETQKYCMVCINCI